MAEHVLIVEAGIPVAGGQKTTICTFTIKGEEENEGLYPRISFLDVVPYNMPRSVSSTSDNAGYVNLTTTGTASRHRRRRLLSSTSYDQRRLIGSGFSKPS